MNNHDYSIYLFGVVSYQYLDYVTLKFNDPIWIRTLVAILFVIDLSLSIVDFYGVWYFTVENYTNPIVMGETIWITPFCCVATAISSLIVQGFLIHRLYRLTSQYWLCAFLVLAAVAASVCGMIDSVRIAILVDMSRFAALVPLTTAWLVTEAGVDIIIAAYVLKYFLAVLSRALWKSKTGSTRTNTIINRCIAASIQSGLFSSVFALGVVVAFLLSPDTYLYAIFAWPLGRIYSNSMLYTLVARKGLAKIAYGTSVAQNTRISSIQIKRETVTDSKVVSSEVDTSLDRYISFSPPPRKI
ncbi:hypothetical protein DL96DRAFT_1552932 [Flagelloscypha sp. PMI_526]|nr:hypothetical protein DL96DRAFT_1552932 [Flagelloscypha sp. PMI_526]